MSNTNFTNAVIEYESGETTVKLSPSIVRNYLVSGGGNVSDQDIVMFLNLCKAQKLNPFIREAYLIKYQGSKPAQIVTGKDVIRKFSSKISFSRRERQRTRHTEVSRRES